MTTKHQDVPEGLANELEKLQKTTHSILDVIAKVEEEAKNYSQCTWHKGCYYCKEGGKWKLIYCIA